MLLGTAEQRHAAASTAIRTWTFLAIQHQVPRAPPLAQGRLTCSLHQEVSSRTPEEDARLPANRVVPPLVPSISVPSPQPRNRSHVQAPHSPPHRLLRRPLHRLSPIPLPPLHQFRYLRGRIRPQRLAFMTTHGRIDRARPNPLRRRPHPRARSVHTASPW